MPRQICHSPLSNVRAQQEAQAEGQQAFELSIALQAGQRFCGMLVGMNASGAGVPVEHAIVLACALRDHLVACCNAQADSAEPPKQRKKRKQKGAPAGDSTEVRSTPWLNLRYWQP